MRLENDGKRFVRFGGLRYLRAGLLCFGFASLQGRSGSLS